MRNEQIDLISREYAQYSDVSMYIKKLFFVLTQYLLIEVVKYEIFKCNSMFFIYML